METYSVKLVMIMTGGHNKKFDGVKLVKRFLDFNTGNVSEIDEILFLQVKKRFSLVSKV